MLQTIRHFTYLFLVTILCSSCTTYSSYKYEEKEKQYMRLEKPLPVENKVLLLTGTSGAIKVAKEKSWWQGDIQQVYHLKTLDMNSDMSQQISTYLRNRNFNYVSPVTLESNGLLASDDVFSKNFSEIDSEDPTQTDKAELYPETIYYLKQILSDYDADTIILVKSKFEYSNLELPPTTFRCNAKDNIDVAFDYNVFFIDAHKMQLIGWRDGTSTSNVTHKDICDNIFGISSQTLIDVMKETRLSTATDISKTIGNILDNNVQDRPKKKKRKKFLGIF